MVSPVNEPLTDFVSAGVGEGVGVFVTALFVAVELLDEVFELLELLEVLDDSERAQQTLEKSAQANGSEWEGVKLVFGKLRNKLQNRGVKAMEVIHQPFDADLHEAVTEIPAPTDELKGKIIDEVVKGYLLNEKVIRHPKVVVGK